MQTIKRSAEALIPNQSKDQKNIGQYDITAALYSKKKQYKVFVEIHDRNLAIEFFRPCFRMKTLPILDQKFDVILERDMRCYMVKSESEFTRLALLKYMAEIKSATKKKNKNKIKINNTI